MNTARIDYINIGLMLFSVILALIIPFELFLFSFIVLGPLHYMTEIGWLKERNFFTRYPKDYWILVALCGLAGCLYLLFEFFDLAVGQDLAAKISDDALLILKKWIPSLIFMGFVAALGIILFDKWLTRLVVIVAGLGLAFALQQFPLYLVIFGIFIPTIIHTTLFTGAFILQGALKNKSLSGYLSFVIFVFCSSIFFFLQMDIGGYVIPKGVQDIFLKGEFYSINYNLYLLLHPNAESKLVLDSAIGLQIQGFIAFAYTYHYLNWFSKTEVIKWHQISRSWLIATVIVWILGIVLYLYDIRLGLAALIFISLLHVFLEFPLNHRSFVGIAGELKKRWQNAMVK